MRNNSIVMLLDRAADNDDRYDYAYDYNYYIVEDNVGNLDN